MTKKILVASTALLIFSFAVTALTNDGAEVSPKTTPTQDSVEVSIVKNPFDVLYYILNLTSL